jgi:hypothetical protein
MDRYLPALRLPLLRLRTSPKELQDTHCARCDGLPTANHSCKQSQISSDVTLSNSAHYNYPSISSLPRSPSSHSPVSSHRVLSSPTGSEVSSSRDSTFRSSLPSAPPTLRRKISPTETSLREIRESQQRLQMKHSEDQLRQLYERQTMEYLYGDYASLDGLRE